MWNCVILYSHQYLWFCCFCLITGIDHWKMHILKTTSLKKKCCFIKHISHTGWHQHDSICLSAWTAPLIWSARVLACTRVCFYLRICRCGADGDWLLLFSVGGGGGDGRRQSERVSMWYRERDWRLWQAREERWQKQKHPRRVAARRMTVRQ